jgi:hypothetical protein
MADNIFNELLIRLRKPWKKTSFTLYFILVVVLFGGIGVIMSLFFDNDPNKSGFISNLMTYSIALSVPACIAILLQYFPKAENKVSLVLLSVSLLLIQVIVIFIFYFLDKGQFLVASLSTVLSWVFWVIANADNVFLDDEAYDENINRNVNELGEQWNKQN